MNLSQILIDPCLSLIPTVMAEACKTIWKKGQSGLVPQKDKNSSFLDGMEVFEDFPNWFTKEDLDYFVSQFQMSGFRAL